MNIILVVCIISLIGIEVFAYTKYGFLSVFLSLLTIIIAILIEQILKKSGYELDIFKTTRKDIKVLDEGTIIDGRIVDIINSNFLSGDIVIPKFLVEKLQKLSNSSDQIEKTTARRGLDIIARLEENEKLNVKILQDNYNEMDNLKRTILLARDLNASIITTDFNVYKNALIENIKVLNINDLALSLKPVILPGEIISIFIVKEGKEKNQGVGYLDDGTMVIIEDGYNYIGRKMEVRVQSLLQTSTGKIIFAKTKFNGK